MIQVKLPEIGENIETAEVSQLLVSEGDTIQANQNVMELESEKAAFGLPSPKAGKVTKIFVKQGDTISVGQPLFEIDETAAGQASPTQATPPKEQQAKKDESSGPQAKTFPAQVTTARAATQVTEGTSERVITDGKGKERRATAKDVVAERGTADHQQGGDGQSKPPAPAGPATRRLARELGVDLRKVKGTQPGGRISRDDVKTYARERLKAGPRERETPALPDFGKWGSIKRQRLNSIARTAAERLSLAWRTIPHVTQHELADITELEAARERFNRSRAEAEPKITVTVLALQASVAALKAFPHFNSSFDAGSGELILKEYYHIGLAVDTKQGLLVAVVRDADKKTTVQLAGEVAGLAEKARNRSLIPEQMEGGTFTISNLGGLGGTGFTPIINYPEVAILGVSRARWERVHRDGKFVKRLLLPLSLSYDHRVINGADAVRFIEKIADLLSDPFKLLAEK
jgi:pyruvate dehydrogenase E2 component (dihydrolipoamide acetyltransferase)